MQMKYCDDLPFHCGDLHVMFMLSGLLFSSLVRNLTLFTEDPEAAYPSQESVWARFDDAFLAISGLVTYAPVFRDYLYQSLEEFYGDNVMYLEIRSGLSKVSAFAMQVCR